MPLFVLGGGSNLVIADEGFERTGPADCVGGMTGRERDGGDALVLRRRRRALGSRRRRRPCARGLAGLECLSGIPGTVGGTPIQNVGAYGQEVADHIDSVTVFDRAGARSWSR